MCTTIIVFMDTQQRSLAVNYLNFKWTSGLYLQGRNGCFCETLVTIYRITWHHKPGEPQLSQIMCRASCRDLVQRLFRCQTDKLLIRSSYSPLHNRRESKCYVNFIYTGHLSSFDRPTAIRVNVLLANAIEKEARAQRRFGCSGKERNFTPTRNQMPSIRLAYHGGINICWKPNAGMKFILHTSGLWLIKWLAAIRNNLQRTYTLKIDTVCSFETFYLSVS